MHCALYVFYEANKDDYYKALLVNYHHFLDFLQRKFVKKSAKSPHTKRKYTYIVMFYTKNKHIMYSSLIIYHGYFT